MLQIQLRKLLDSIQLKLIVFFASLVRGSRAESNKFNWKTIEIPAGMAFYSNRTMFPKHKSVFYLPFASESKNHVKLFIIADL